MEAASTFKVTPSNGRDTVYKQDCKLEAYISRHMFLNREIDMGNVEDYCRENEIDLKNCGCLGLRCAVVFNDDLADRIFTSIRGNLEISCLGATPLLISMLDISPYYSCPTFAAMKKMVEAGADVNTVISDTTHEYWRKTLPRHATPLFIAVEIHKHILAAMLLLKHKAVAHPKLSEEGSQLIRKATWLETSGKLLFLSLYFEKAIFKCCDMPLELTTLITQLTLCLE